MEKVIERLGFPFWIIAIAGIAIMLSQLHNNYWQGQLAKARYLKEFDGK